MSGSSGLQSNIFQANKNISFSSYKPVSFLSSNIAGLEIQELADPEDQGSFWVRVNGSHCIVTGDRYRSTQQWAKYIRDDLNDIKKSFITLGFHLWEIQTRGFYLHDFYTYVEDQFGLCRSTATKLIAVFKEFSDDYSPRLNKAYEHYSYSQLENMLPIPKDKRNNINPTMTVAKIKDFCKSLKGDNRVADIREVVKTDSDQIDGRLDYEGHEYKSVEVADIREVDLNSEVSIFSGFEVVEKGVVLSFSRYSILHKIASDIRAFSDLKMSMDTSLGLLFYFLESSIFAEYFRNFYHQQKELRSMGQGFLRNKFL